MADRTNALEIINTERDNQAQWESGEQQSVGEEILLISHYVDQARSKWKAELAPEIGTLKEIAKIGAIALRCLENHSKTDS